MRLLIDYRREIGSAAWLLLVYWNHASPTVDPNWCPVSNGNAIHDAAAAQAGKTSVATAKRWRRRLERAGLIHTESCGADGFRIWLLRFDRPENVAPTQSTPAESWPEMKTLLVQ